MKEHRTPASLCPACGAMLAGAGELPGQPERGPEPGDFTLCPGCATLLRFGDGLMLCIATEAEQAEGERECPEVMEGMRRLRGAVLLAQAVAKATGIPFPPEGPSHARH